MDATMTNIYVEQIGETAGTIWHALDEHGSMSVAKLTKTVGAPRDLVLQAVGWLARESKLEITENNRGKTVSLRS